MHRIAKAVLAAAAVVLGVSGTALAQEAPQCGPRDELVKALADQYSETVVSAGVSESGNLVEIYAAPDGKTWTAVVSSPAGVSCVAAAGADWQTVRDVLPGQGT